MNQPLLVRPAFDFSNTKGKLPPRALVNGGAFIQQADDLLFTLKPDGTLRATDLRPMEQQLGQGPLHDTLAQYLRLSDLPDGGISIGVPVPVPAKSLKANLLNSAAVAQDVSLATLAAAGNPLGDAIAAKIGDAPNDGTSYVRKNLGWAILPSSTGGIAEAPTDGQSYLRKNSAWAAAPDFSLLAPKLSPALTGAPTATTPIAGDNSTRIATTAYVDRADATKIGEAPNDGAYYARQNRGWLAFTPGGTLDPKAVNYIGRRFDVADYGAPLNGDCAAALRAAIDALNASPTGGTIVVSGSYSCLSTVDKTISTGHHFAMEGTTAGSAIYFSGISGTGLTIRAGAFDVRLSVKNISFYVDQSPNLTDLVVLRGGGDHGCIVVNNINMAGSTAAVPNNFLVCVNPLDCVFREINIDGRSGPYGPSDFRGAGVYCFGDKQLGASVCTGIMFDACTINRVGTGVNVVGAASSGSTSHTIEGLHFRNCTISGVGTAVTYTSPGDLIPGMGFYGGHINACKYAFGFTRIAQFKISDVLMYMDVNYQPQAFIITSGICYDLNIHNNTFYMVDTQGSGLTPGINAIILQNQAQGCLITDNLFDMKTADPVIRIDAGARANAYGFNKRVVNGGNASATLVDITVSDAGTGTINLSAGAATVAGLTDATAAFKALNVAAPLANYVKRDSITLYAQEYCKFDGSDDDAGWQALVSDAANRAYIHVVMPAGTTYVSPGVLSFAKNTGVHFEGAGEGVTIIRNKAGSGPILAIGNSSHANAIQLNGFSIWVAAANTSAYAIDVNCALGTDYHKVGISDVSVQYRDGRCYGGLHLKNVGNGRIQFKFRGYNQETTAFGVVVDGNCYNCFIDIDAIFCDVAAVIAPNSYSEEIHFEGQIVLCNWGIYAYNAPADATHASPRTIRWMRGHMETLRGGIFAEGRPECMVISGLIWKREESTQDWIGVQFNNCPNSLIQNNRFWGRVNYVSGGNSTGAWLNNSSGTQVTNNNIAGTTYCVDPRNNTAALVMGNTYDAKTTSFMINTAGGSVVPSGTNAQLNVSQY